MGGWFVLVVCSFWWLADCLLACRGDEDEVLLRGDDVWETGWVGFKEDQREREGSTWFQEMAARASCGLRITLWLSTNREGLHDSFSGYYCLAESLLFSNS